MQESTTATTVSVADHLAVLDRRMRGRPWRHVESASERPSRARCTEPPCIEPDDSFAYMTVRERKHPEHHWIDATYGDAVFADVAPGSQYHERCANCGIYRTRHSSQGQTDGGMASYYEYYEWGTAPPESQTVKGY